MLSVQPYTQPETSHRARIGGAIARVTVRWSIASVTLTARETASRAASEVESSVMPAPKISPSDYPELVRLHVREQWSHARLGQHFGCHPSVVTRTLKRVPVVELADAEHRKEAAARRAQEYRDRQAEKAASPEALAEKLTGHPVDSADHLTIKTPRGDRIMFRSKKNGLWYREGVCGPVRAKRSDFEGKVPRRLRAGTALRSRSRQLPEGEVGHVHEDGQDATPGRNPRARRGPTSQPDPRARAGSPRSRGVGTCQLAPGSGFGSGRGFNVQICTLIGRGVCKPGEVDSGAAHTPGRIST
jgi:hypothetical protein